MKEYPLYLANKSLMTQEKFIVKDKYSQQDFASVSIADQTVLKKAIDQAVIGAIAMREMASFERHAILEQCVQGLIERKDELIDTLCMEVGKTLVDAKSEVLRAINTFQVAKEESTRIYGEVIPLDIIPQAKEFVGFWKRFPIGPCLFITPFNFPLNLVAHKIAPAIACGCPFIVKPSQITPVSAVILGEILSKTNLPAGAFSIVPCETIDAKILVEDDRIKLLSFTGSSKVGWELKEKASKKQVVLELGGNASCIIDEDLHQKYKDNAFSLLVDRLIWGAFYLAGQSCISVQKIYIHQTIYSELKEALVKKATSLKMGNPREEQTFIGPMISKEAATRLEDWIKEAIQHGAKLLCGGSREGALLMPTLLENVAENEKLSCLEAFGPVAILTPFNNFSELLKQINQSHFGLQAGLYTRDLYKVNEAFNALEVGGLIINDVPSYRSDNMPYGGVKESGIGREGVKFAIDHLTEIRMLAMRF